MKGDFIPLFQYFPSLVEEETVVMDVPKNASKGPPQAWVFCWGLYK